MGVECPKCKTENTSDSEFCKKCATPLPSSEEISVSHTETIETPTKELTRGTIFASRHEIIEELGTGGMGKVYRVKDEKFLSLWKDADLGIAEVENARERLAEVKSQ